MAKQVHAAVVSAADDKFYYGYKTEPDAGIATLGVMNLATSSPIKDVAFHPKNVAVWSAYKPGIVARGGLCSYDKLNPLETAGYLISRRRLNVPKGGQKSVIVGVRLTPNLVFTWRYPKTRWDALPQDVKTAAGVALASTFPANECAFHADGFIFATAIPELDIPAGVYISKTVLKRTHASAGGKSYTVYTGKTAPAVP
jgi:hypothetical protein